LLTVALRREAPPRRTRDSQGRDRCRGDDCARVRGGTRLIPTCRGPLDPRDRRRRYGRARLLPPGSEHAAVDVVALAEEERMNGTTPAALNPQGSETTIRPQEAKCRRRLLVIVRDYPPANTPATLRALGFARYLPEFGWDVSVVTTRGGFHSSSDCSL